MLSVVLESNVPSQNTSSTMNGDDGVCVVFALNRSFYSTTSVHPVSVLNLHPREHTIPKKCFMMPTTPAVAVVCEAYCCGLSPLLALCTDSLVFPSYFLLQHFGGHFTVLVLIRSTSSHFLLVRGYIVIRTKYCL